LNTQKQLEPSHGLQPLPKMRPMSNDIWLIHAVFVEKAGFSSFIK